MRKLLLLVAFESCVICVGVVANSLATAIPIWVWGVGVSLFGVVIPVALYGTEAKAWIEERRFRSSIQADMPEARFKALYPRIKNLKDAGWPYPENEVRELSIELSFLGISHPVDVNNWPKWIGHLAELSRMGKLQQARQIPDYLDLRLPQ